MKINKIISKAWARYHNNRKLKGYYRSQFGSSGGGKYFLILLAFLLSSFYILRQALTFRQVWLQLLFVTVGLILGLRILQTRKNARLRKLCQERTGEAEFKKRLEKTDPAEVLQYLGEKIVRTYNVTDLSADDQALSGRYLGEKLGIFYRQMESEDVLSTQEMLALLRGCKQQGLTQVRVFVNTDYIPKAKGLGDRFAIQLRTYNGPQLTKFLADSPLYPSSYEVDTLIKGASEKRLRRLGILQKEAMRGNKSSMYLIYSGVLWIMTWFGIGYAYWNMGFGLIMLGLAALSWWQNRSKSAEEDIVF